jgi:hypothetical protein
MSGWEYVAVAYVVFLGTVLSYVAIISLKLARLERELAELAAEARRQDRRRDRQPVPVATGVE